MVAVLYRKAEKLIKTRKEVLWRRALPLAIIGCEKSVAAQNPTRLVTETVSATHPAHRECSLAFNESLRDGFSRALFIPLLPWAVDSLLSCRVLSRVRAFSFACRVIKSVIVPAHCFSLFYAVFINNRASRHHCRSRQKQRTRRQKENPLHPESEKKHLFAQLIRRIAVDSLRLASLSSSSSNTIAHIHCSITFFLNIKSVYCVSSFCVIIKTAFQPHNFFGCWRERTREKGSSGVVVMVI